MTFIRVLQGVTRIITIRIHKTSTLNVPPSYHKIDTSYHSRHSMSDSLDS